MDGRVVRPTVEREVNEEFSFHVEMRVQELVERGWSEEEARAEAIRRFGDIERVKADCRNLGTRRDVTMNRRLWWDEIRQDLAYALRQLKRAPAFAAVTILTLGVAIGANTAVFSVVNGVLFTPLPYTDAEELTMLWTRYLPESGFDIDKFALSGPELLDIQETTTSLASLGAWTTGSRALTGDNAEAERIMVGVISAEVLPILNTTPHIGRWFTEEEDVPEGPAVTILGYDLWTNRYGADPSVLGQSILMNGVSTEVVGVMPEGFSFPSNMSAWLPMGLDRTNEGGRASHGYYAIGRVAPGNTPADVDAELAVYRERWASEYEHNEAHYVWANSLRAESLRDAPARLALLMAAVGLILLIACVNIANLLMARGERRNNEVAVRTALGAGRGRITRQLATESLVLAGLAALLGLVLAVGGTNAMIAIDPTAIPRLADVRLDGTVLGFTFGVTLLTALLFGIVPAYLSGRSAAIAGSESRTVGGRRTSSLRRGLVTGEVAVSLVVVILAGLVVRSFTAISAVDTNMNPENLLTFSLSIPTAAVPNDAIVPAEYEGLLEQIRAVPGVVDATAANSLPFRGTGQWDFELDDRPPRQDGEIARNAGIAHVTTDYFETMGIPILEGRALTPQDGRGAPLVAVVSELMASRFWPGESAIGKRFGYDKEEGVPWITIVGVVPNRVLSDLGQDPYPYVYVPQAQGGISTYFVPRAMNIVVRSGLTTDAVLPGVRQTVADFDSNLPMYNVSTMEETIDDSLAGRRILANLLGAFAFIALGLAAVGIYGVISYSVEGRSREIGVRVALGAERRRITGMILREGTGPVLFGTVIGLAGAYFATKAIQSMLYGVEPTDPVTFTVLPLGLIAVGVIASWLPALRATRIAPTEALRDD